MMKTTRGRIITGWRHVVPPKSPSFPKASAKAAASASQPQIAPAADANLAKAKAEA